MSNDFGGSKYGCTVHEVVHEAAIKRWNRVVETINATSEDDHDAQWSVIGMCGCCCGPTKITEEPAHSTFMCSRCCI